VNNTQFDQIFVQTAAGVKWRRWTCLRGNDLVQWVVFTTLPASSHGSASIMRENSNWHQVPFLNRGEYVQEILFKLWRNDQEKNWSVEINGERHEAVTIEWVQELVYRAVLDAEDSLLTTKRPPQ
jgi:hypothetical protein